MEEFMDKETCVAFYEDAKVNARHSRIEAQFRELLTAALSGLAAAHESGGKTVVVDLTEVWSMAERAECFLESKRAEVKDGK